MRATLLQQKCPKNTHFYAAMLAVGLSVRDVEKIQKTTPYGLLTSITPERRNGAEWRLKVPFAFHSSQVDAILDAFRSAAQGIIFNALKILVLSTLLGKAIAKAGIFNPQCLSRHCRGTFSFVAALESAKMDIVQDGTAWIGIGPRPVVGGLLRSNISNVTILPKLQRDKDTWKVLTSGLATLYPAGVGVNWNQYHRDFAASLSVIQLPAYNWDLKNYWMQYTEHWFRYKGGAGFLQGRQPEIFTTTSVQRLVAETIEGKMTTVIVESDPLREDLDPMFRGHRVNGVALCTPSVYADIALTVGDYLRKKNPQWARMER
ncbi:hypothetical protein VTL71DRAFT_15634 [Oculimacula yallundae]|uniref:Malonyl-CoA:ACP transacylase (MAT) domain-containing protein n=1 Tax=Oculimacula yallundae TaxID=86028 RepID=A0ABR4CH52_9HELO